MPALPLLLGLAGVTSVGTAAYTFRATFANPSAQQPAPLGVKLTTWEILAGVGMVALLGPVGASIGAGLAAGGLVAWHDTAQVQKGLAAFAASELAKLQPVGPGPAQQPGPAPVSPVGPPAAAPGGFWQAPGRAISDLWSSIWSPTPVVQTGP